MKKAAKVTNTLPNCASSRQDRTVSSLYQPAPSPRNSNTKMAFAQPMVPMASPASTEDNDQMRSRRNIDQLSTSTHWDAEINMKFQSKQSNAKEPVCSALVDIIPHVPAVALLEL